MKSPYLFCYIFLFILCISCKKEELNVVTLASINISNAVVGGTPLKFGSNTLLVPNNGNASYSVKLQSDNIYVYPLGDSLHPYFNQSMSLENGGMYSLFLSGQANAVEALWIKETIPYRRDSVAGIRFINLSPNSPSVRVALAATPDEIEFDNISYKQITDFKTYPLLSTSGPYTFQVTDAGTNAVIASYTLTVPLPRFQNITLVLGGLVGGVPAPIISRINNY